MLSRSVSVGVGSVGAGSDFVNYVVENSDVDDLINSVILFEDGVINLDDEVLRTQITNILGKEGFNSEASLALKKAGFPVEIVRQDNRDRILYVVIHTERKDIQCEFGI